MRREDVEYLLAVGLSAAGLDDVAEHDLLPGIVDARLEDEAPAAFHPTAPSPRGGAPGLPRVLDRPARERARDFGHVLLRIAAVDAERVQLHQLAAVVLVESSARPGRLPL